jgi:hypothetical protein
MPRGDLGRQLGPPSDRSDVGRQHSPSGPATPRASSHQAGAGMSVGSSHRAAEATWQGSSGTRRAEPRGVPVPETFRPSGVVADRVPLARPAPGSDDAERSAGKAPSA